MKPLIIALLLTLSAQTPDWKLIKEMSGDIPNHPGLTIETYGAEIARGNDEVKLLVKTEFPNGAPRLEGATYPTGFDPTSVSRIEIKIRFNCASLVMTPVKGSARVFQFTGKEFKSKEVPFNLNSGHVFVKYFCERGETPTKAPVLKPK